MSNGGMTFEEPLEGRRILIVENEIRMAQELQGLLQQNGCSVIGLAPDIGRAMTLLEQERPDAVLLDLHLNGKQTTAVAATLSARNVPFVLLNGRSPMQLKEPELQARPCVSKPVNQKELVRALTEVLGYTGVAAHR